MAKLIKLTPEIIEETQKEFSEYLKDKISDGRVSFSKTINVIQRKATVWFAEIAWKKFQALVKDFDKEVAWHGLAYRNSDPDKDEYYITDILVYPQEVTGATVTTDQSKYQTWLIDHDDETFNNIRMQGHSHVNMDVTPSSVDSTLYESILSQLDDTMFYIFMIWNKRGDKTCKIYDLAKNVLFDTADCEIKVVSTATANVSIDGVSEEEKDAMLTYLKDYRYEKICKQFVEDAKQLVTTRVYTPSYRQGSYGWLVCDDGDHSDYGGYYGGYARTNSKSSQQAASGNNAKKNNDAEKRRGKRKGYTKTAAHFDDDDDDLYDYDSRYWT